MSVDFRAVLKELTHPTATRRQAALTAIQSAEQTVARQEFCSFARRLSAVAALPLCRTLAEATAAEFIDVLGSYANTDDARLRESALAALIRVPRTLRATCVRNLLASPIPETRSAACQLIARDADAAAVPHLMARLADEYSEVILSALAALRTLAPPGCQAELLPLLSHSHEEVRRETIFTLAELSTSTEFPTAAIINRLRYDPSPVVVSEAASALEKRPSPLGCEALLQKVSDSHDPEEIQCAILRALTAYPEEKVVEALLHIASAATHASVALAATRSLNAYPETLILAVGKRLLVNENLGLRLQTLEVMGSIDVPGVSSLLIDHLHREKDPEARAATLEAIGQGGWIEAWDAIRSCLHEASNVAYSAVCALADLLDESHLNDYLYLLNRLDDAILREAALKRLTLYGRSRELPDSLWPDLQSLLQHESLNVAMLAAEAAGYLGGSAAIPELLRSLPTRPEPAYRTAVSLSIRRLCRGNLLSVLEGPSAECLQELALAIPEWPNFGHQGALFCRKLAAWVGDHRPGAGAALLATALREPLAVAEAMNDCAQSELTALFAVWQELPQQQRQGTRLNLRRLLDLSQPQARLMALEAIDASDDPTLLPRLVDLALDDEDATVRSAACEATRRIVEV